METLMNKIGKKMMKLHKKQKERRRALNQEALAQANAAKEARSRKRKKLD